MRKFLIAGSSLASVATAGSVGAVDITLGGSIDMGIEFGIGKTNDNLTVTSGYNNLYPSAWPIQLTAVLFLVVPLH